MKDQLLTVEAAACELKVSARTIARMMKDGELTRVPTSDRRVCVRASEVAAVKQRRESVWVRKEEARHGR